MNGFPTKHDQKSVGHWYHNFEPYPFPTIFPNIFHGKLYPKHFLSEGTWIPREHLSQHLAAVLAFHRLELVMPRSTAG